MMPPYIRPSLPVRRLSLQAPREKPPERCCASHTKPPSWLCPTFTLSSVASLSLSLLAFILDMQRHAESFLRVLKNLLLGLQICAKLRIQRMPSASLVPAKPCFCQWYSADFSIACSSDSTHDHGFRVQTQRLHPGSAGFCSERQCSRQHVLQLLDLHIMLHNMICPLG